MPDLTTLQDLAANARQKSDELRNRRREAANVAIRGATRSERSLNGLIFVEDIGDVLLFDQGVAEFVYVPEALAMRRVSLEANETTRRQFFEAIARGISSRSDILNIGAGTDNALIEAFQNVGHAVVATDFAHNVVSELASRVHAPTFAGDLVELDALLPPLSVDYVIGNSTLGFVDPAKLERVVRNIVSVSRRGGIFTFDLTPHSDYYLLAQGTKATQTCINASRPDPQILVEYVSSLGAVPGVLAAAAYSNRLGTAVQLGVLVLLIQLFADMGWVALVTYQNVNYVQGDVRIYVLRASPRTEDFGEVPHTEIRIDNLDQFFTEIDFSKVLYVPSAMDRERAATLAPLMGITCSPRDAPLRVIDKATDIAHRNPDVGANADVLRRLAPSRIAAVIMPYVRQRADYVRPRRMRQAVETDQVLHTQMFEGTSPISREQAEMIIDRLYEAERKKGTEQEKARLATIRQEEEKKRRKQQKNNRKRNRRK